MHNGYTQVLKVPNAMPVEGGIPLICEGKVIGAIGVSGGNPQQDGQASQAGAGCFCRDGSIKMTYACESRRGKPRESPHGNSKCFALFRLMAWRKLV